MSDSVYPCHIILYSKPGCHLCDIARDWIEVFAADPYRYQPLVVDEVDIRSDAVLFERYRDRIPVVVVEGMIVIEGRMDDVAEKTLARALGTPRRPIS